MSNETMVSGGKTTRLANAALVWFSTRTNCWYTTEQVMAGIDHNHRPSTLKLLHSLVASQKLTNQGRGKILWKMNYGVTWDRTNPFLLDDGSMPVDTFDPNVMG